jgi:xylan 1,4-beta-xylosidase
MSINFNRMQREIVEIDAGQTQGRIEAWRHTIGQGGVNHLPFPERVENGLQKLRPRLARVFLQEYFNVYPEHGVYNWDRLDPYLESIARTGAKVLATINFKPKPLYPEVDQDIWRPNNVEEWQELIAQLVRRYSVEKRIVTYWESANEPDIGEYGGCPFRLKSPEEIYEFYAMTIKPVLEVFPEAKVGGPCPADNRLVLPFLDQCAQHGTRLDFVSWHLYEDDPAVHRSIAEKIAQRLESFPGKRPETMVNEWNKGFDFPEQPTPGVFELVSVEEMAMQPRRAAHVARILLEMLEAPINWSFYFLAWDNCLFNEDFRRFFSPQGLKNVMYIHWNEAPHRFGLFGENSQVRPQYFVYQMLSKLAEERVCTTYNSPDLCAISTRDEKTLSTLVVNFRLEGAKDGIVKLGYRNLEPGMKRITAYRIDEGQCWDSEALELIPIETRMVDVQPGFSYQFFCPADSVLLARLEEV